MTNKQYYSCERNHYFFGKLMTVRDFESEQIYFNSKRRLGNRFLGGVGVVSGLNVLLVDNKTISVEAGMAVDYSGREIIVAEPSVKRLSVIKGFEENRESEDLYLCIKYRESLKESTFSVAGSGKDSGVSQEYNRIQEGYDLFLTSKEPKREILGGSNFIIQKVPVYHKNGIEIYLEVFKYTNPGALVKVKMIFEKVGVSDPVKFQFDVKGNLFKPLEDGDALHVNFFETEVKNYNKYKREYYLKCDAVSDANAELIIDKDSFKIEIGQDVDTISNDVKQLVDVTLKPIKDVIIDNYYSKHFDDIVEEKEGQYIYLAKFHISSNQATYFIESYEKNPFDQYLLNNELITVLQDFYSQPLMLSNTANISSVAPTVQKEIIAEKKDEEVPQKKNDIISGVEKINLGFYPKVGKTYYSYEFVHGLGYGKIGVIVAVESKANYLNNNDNALLFGNPAIFSGEDSADSEVNADVGAVVNPDKGTMKLALKLKEKTNIQSVDVRWWAFKPDTLQQSDENEKIIESGNVKLTITPNTVRVAPLGKVRFSAHVEGRSNQEIKWRIADQGLGEIDTNGVYTAPAKEGVYEIIAECVTLKDVSDSAYVVVSADE